MQELQVQSLGLENPLEKEWQPISVFLLGNPMIRGVWPAAVHSVKKESDMN